MESKYSVKKLQTQVRCLQGRKAELKKRVQELKMEVFELRAREQKREEGTQTVKKELDEIHSNTPEGFRLTLPYHSYSVGHMELYLKLVLCASAGLRCSSRMMEMVLKLFGLHAGAPSWWCGRLWVLRLGYFKLSRAKEQASDWVWIIDHTVQLGSQKCFVILGTRLSNLSPAGQCLRHEDMEPINPGSGHGVQWGDCFHAVGGGG
jgi:hypothetical protein